MRIPTAVLDDVDYHAAVRDELSARNRYLPPPLADHALRDHVDELASRLKTRMRRDFDPALQDSVLARKAGRGSRPLPYLALEDRFTYRALVDVIVGHLTAVPDRGRYDEFANSPLAVDECNYVLKADISAYYQYIDHERLIDEVIAQTGDDLAITAIVELLQGGTGRQFGLPQMIDSSDILGDLYIDPIRRNLIRLGYHARSYADDFRVACVDYNDALEALEHIERSAFELGLVLNESKTGTPSKETYKESRTEIDRIEEKLFREQAPDTAPEDLLELLGLFGAAVAEGYTEVSGEDLGDVVAERASTSGSQVPGEDLGDGGSDGTSTHESRLLGEEHDEVDPSGRSAGGLAPTTVQLEVAARVVSDWQDEEIRDTKEWNSHIWSTLLRKSLGTLEAGRDTRAVDAAIALLVNEPHLTPQVCNYLVAVGQDNPKRVNDVLHELCGRERSIVSIWQSLWIAYLAGSLSNTPHPQDQTNKWLEEQVAGPHDAVSVQAALALARRRQLSVELGARAYSRASEPHRLTAALALAAARGVNRDAEIGDDQIERWLDGWARKQPWGKPIPNAVPDQPLPDDHDVTP